MNKLSASRASLHGITSYVIWFVGFLWHKRVRLNRIPCLSGVAKKVWMRLKWFIKEAVPFVLVGVLIANLLYTFGVIQFIGKIAAPVFNHF